MTTARKLLRLVWAAARWQTVAAVALSTLLSLTEGVSLAAIFPLIALLGNGPGVAAGPRTQWLFHLLATTGLPRGLWLPVLLAGLVTAIGVLAQLNGILASLEQRVLLRVQERLALQTFDAMLHADWAYLAQRRASDLTHLLTSEVLRVGQLAANVLALIANGMVTLLLLGVAASLAPLLTLIVGLCFALLIPLQRRSRRLMAQGGAELTQRSRAVYDSAAERLGHLKAIKAYAAQEAELATFRERYSAVSEALRVTLWRRNAAARHFQLLSIGLLCAVLLLGLRGLHLPAVSLLVFLAAFMRMIPRLNMLQMSASALVVDMPALQSVETLLSEARQHSEQQAGDEPAPQLKISLQLRGVAFAYGSNAVLAGLDLDLPAGRITAIAGLSGAGKSTVADLILPLLFPQQGQVTVDGVAITRANAKSWRRRVGYVSQDTLLFHDSVRANLLWAQPHAGESALRAAIDTARADFVWQLQNGLETIVGDRGIMLSHGQRQRLALARAFLLRPELLILDEATNSLDLENEESVLHTVLGQTVLLISHRPSALRMADWIYVLEGGKVALQGTWDQVRARIECDAVL